VNDFHTKNNFTDTKAIKSSKRNLFLAKQDNEAPFDSNNHAAELSGSWLMNSEPIRF
jgi:hypothetical protein